MVLDPSKALFTPKEAAEALGIKERSLRTERIQGRLGYKKVAGKYMHRRQDLEKWLELGEDACPDATAAPTFSGSPNVAATISAGPSTAERENAAPVQQIASKLKQHSETSSPAGPIESDHVIRGNFRS